MQDMKHGIARVHRAALEYVVRTGIKLPVAAFDEDNEPIGPMLREDLYKKGWLREIHGNVEVTDEGMQFVRL